MIFSPNLIIFSLGINTLPLDTITLLGCRTQQTLQRNPKYSSFVHVSQLQKKLLIFLALRHTHYTTLLGKTAFFSFFFLTLMQVSPWLAIALSCMSSNLMWARPLWCRAPQQSPPPPNPQKKKIFNLTHQLESRLTQNSSFFIILTKIDKTSSMSMYFILKELISKWNPISQLPLIKSPYILETILLKFSNKPPLMRFNNLYCKRMLPLLKTFKIFHFITYRFLISSTIRQRKFYSHGSKTININSQQWIFLIVLTALNFFLQAFT